MSRATRVRWILFVHTMLAALGWGWLVTMNVPEQYWMLAAGVGGLWVGVIALHLSEELTR